jgi:hypothetical protein
MPIVAFVQVFVDHPSYHRPGSLYGDNFGAFGDNQVNYTATVSSLFYRQNLCHINWLAALYMQFRYTLLCYAACEAPLILELGGYIYGQNCMFVVNDWHASLVPVYVYMLLLSLHFFYAFSIFVLKLQIGIWSLKLVNWIFPGISSTNHFWI